MTKYTFSCREAIGNLSFSVVVNGDNMTWRAPDDAPIQGGTAGTVSSAGGGLSFVLGLNSAAFVMHGATLNEQPGASGRMTSHGTEGGRDWIWTYERKVGGGGGAGGGGGCLASGTPVVMADGSRRAIEHVHVGELVLGFSKIDRTPTPARVIARSSEFAPITVVLVFASGDRVRATPRQVVATSTGPVRASELFVGATHFSALSENSTQLNALEWVTEDVAVHCLEYEGTDFVLMGDATPFGYGGKQ